MRKIVTLMLALGGFTVGCGDEQTDEALDADPRAQLIDASTPVSPEGVDGGAAADDSDSADAGTRLGTATATIEPRSGNTELAGTLFLAEGDGTVTATLTVTGAPPGQHGAHIHAKGDCSAPDGTSAGDHWNPTSGTHGAPDLATSHLGDLGNLTVDADGTGTLTIDNAKWSIGDGSATDVVGKAIVIHAAADDLTSQPSGNAGARIGCGVIQAAD